MKKGCPLPRGRDHGPTSHSQGSTQTQLAADAGRSQPSGVRQCGWHQRQTLAQGFREEVGSCGRESSPISPTQGAHLSKGKA